MVIRKSITPGKDWQFRNRTINETNIRRDIIVIGASAGGVILLKQLFTELPKRMPAVLAVVLHRGAAPGELIEVLAKRACWPVMEPSQGTPVKPGIIYMAPSDHHLRFGGGTLLVDRGPKEHSTRPAVDPLFRSAAEEYGNRVVGVILTGCGDDGVAGMIAIKQGGGICLAQHPEEAYMPSMPQNAICYDDVDQALPVSRLVPVLAALARGETVKAAA